MPPCVRLVFGHEVRECGRLPMARARRICCRADVVFGVLWLVSGRRVRYCRLLVACSMLPYRHLSPRLLGRRLMWEEVLLRVSGTA